MTWLKIDDGFEDHPKVEPLSDAAHRLWMRAACWCQKQKNSRDKGFVPRAMLRTIAKRSHSTKRLDRLAEELANADGGGLFESGLWEEVKDAEGVVIGWKFHDWDAYQPSTEDSQRRRTEKAKKAAQARWSNARGNAQASPEHRAKQCSNDAPNAPDPVPDPVPDPDAAVAAPTRAHTRETGDDSGGMVNPPTSLESALELPVGARASLLTERPDLGQWTLPERWPEVTAAVDVFREATEQPNLRVGSFARDSGVRALVELFAAGFTPGELERAIRAAVQEPWWRESKRGLSSLSVEVVRRALDPKKPKARDGPRRGGTPTQPNHGWTPKSKVIS